MNSLDREQNASAVKETFAEAEARINRRRSWVLSKD